ncbi:MAG: hypothetical protein IPK52_27375 [Chloroflexi bacterium]|nr:hypothetical protein [Chloroflexota bacterium]
MAVVTAPIINTAASTCDDSGRTLAVTFADPTATFTLDHLLLGGTCTIVYTVTINDLAYANATYSNSATATYTSIPGSDPNERIEPSIGPVTSDFTTPDPTVEKTLTSSSLTSTPGNNLTIGETATYTIVYTFPEGTSCNVTLIDSLPQIDNEGAALEFVSASITAVGAGITSPAFALPQAAVPTDSVLDADTVNDTATWALGNIISTGDNVANSIITVTVIARPRCSR